MASPGNSQSPGNPATDLRQIGRVDGLAKVSGQARYTADLSLPGLLHGAVVRSPYPHARIVAIRTEQALAAPGVHAVLTAADIPYGLYGRRVLDTPALTADVARFIGDRVAAVAAETPAQAAAAAALVEVDYEPLPAVVDPAAALAPGAPAIHAEPWRYQSAVVKPEDPPNLQSRFEWRGGGDADAALAASHRVFSHTFSVQPQHQGYLEPHACVAWVRPEAVEIWSADKGPYVLRNNIATWLGIRPDRVQVHPVPVGGDFGGKGGPMEAPLCVALSEKTGRPVKLRMRYVEDLIAANPRHSGQIAVRIGVNPDGLLTAMAVDCLLNGGAYGGCKPMFHVHIQGLNSAAFCYRVPALRISSRIAYTNTVPRGHMRAPGAPQMNFAVESLMDMAARELGLDPVQFRRQNLLRTGDTGPLGQDWWEVRSAEALDAALAALPAPPAVAAASAPASDWATGTGLSLYARAVHSGQTEVGLQPEPDGSLTVWVPFPEQGGGQLTVARSVILRHLGLPPEQVHIRQGELDDLFYDNGVGGSRTTIDATEALTQACHELQRRLREEHHLPGRPAAEELQQALAAFARAGNGEQVRIRLEKWDKPHHVISYCAHIAQVQVDRRTGQVQINHLVTALDVAEILNPTSFMGQIEGGIAMALGHALLEDLAIKDGQITAANLGEYKLPTVQDLPPTTIALVKGGRGLTELNIKPIGEMSNVAVAAAVANAIHDAVGVRIDSLPLTAEKVHAALRTAAVSPA